MNHFLGMAVLFLCHADLYVFDEGSKRITLQDGPFSQEESITATSLCTLLILAYVAPSVLSC